MKKLLLAALLLTGLTAFAPSASAGHRERVFVGYDRCGHPVYHEVYRPSRGYCEERPTYYYEERPTYYRPAPQVRYRSYDNDDRQRCREPQRRVSPLSFFFGF